MKSTGLCICGGVLVLSLPWLLAPGAQADDATDHANQQAQAQKEREDWQNQQAQKEREDWQNELYQAQKERDDYINRLWQDNVKNIEDLRKSADEQNQSRQDALDQPQAPWAGPMAVAPCAPCPRPAAVCRPAALAAVPQVRKMNIYNGPVPTVAYSVQGGSSQLQALVQTLQSTENEFNLASESPKTRPGLAQDTSALADELVKLREQVQTQLQAEQAKAVAAACGEPPAWQKPPVPPLAHSLAVPRAVAQQSGMLRDPVAFAQMVRQNQEKVRQQILQTQQQMLQRSRRY